MKSLVVRINEDFVSWVGGITYSCVVCSFQPIGAKRVRNTTVGPPGVSPGDGFATRIVMAGVSRPPTHRRLYSLRSDPTGRGWVAGTRPAMTERADDDGESRHDGKSRHAGEDHGGRRAMTGRGPGRIRASAPPEGSEARVDWYEARNVAAVCISGKGTGNHHHRRRSPSSAPLASARTAITRYVHP